MPPLTPTQRAAVEHPGGPLAVVGGAGTGKTTVLAERFAWLVADGLAPEVILVLARDADGLRARIETRLERGFEELHVATLPGFCARLLHDEAIEAGLGPFMATASAADRLAMLLDRIDELSVRLHDFRGSPAAMLAGIVARIDRLKEQAVTAQAYADWAATRAGGTDSEPQTDREREFAQIFLAHDRMLTGQALLDEGELVLRAQALLDDKPHVRERTLARFRHVLVDDLGDLTPAQLTLLGLLGEELTVTASDPALAEGMPTITLDRSLRSREQILVAAGAVWPSVPAGEPGGEVRFWRCANERAQAQAVAAEVARLLREGTAPERVAVLVRSVRNEGQAVAVALEERAVPHRLVGDSAFFQRAEVRDVLAWLRLLVDPADAGAAVRALARPPVELRSVDLARCIQIARRRKLDMVSALVAATESPQLPPEARERILAFLKLHRAAAGALDSTRPDLFVHRLIERLGLRRQQLFSAQADVVERLRNLSRLGELAAAYVRRSPQATPREFARYVSAVADAGLRDDEPADTDAPGDAVAVTSMQAARSREFDHVFVLGLQSARMPGARSRLVEPIPAALLGPTAAGGVCPGDGTREAHVVEMRRLLHLAMTRARDGLVLAFAAHTDSGAMQPPSPFAEEARAALGAEWEDREEELFGPDESLHATYQALRDELIAGIPRTGNRLGELRLDTDLDVAHGTVRYLELLKVSALLARVGGGEFQSVAEALPGINAAILQAATAQQREILESSPLDDALLDAERDARARAAAVAARDEPSLEAFLPRRGEGLLLSASDIDTYRTCPLKYKFARVFRIPSEPTLYQRFGIFVHQVLERYHQADVRNVDELLGLIDAGWRRGGFGSSEEERQLRGKADAALRRYHDRFEHSDSEPVWFERGFQFRMGAHTLRGRVDRVDRLPDGGYELIDYKTGRPKTVAQLRDDVQLSLYAVGAREAWDLDASRQSYLYVLDDEKVPVPHEDIDRDWIADTVSEVADGISSQGFEPTPSYAACSICDYRIVCPAAER